MIHFYKVSIGSRNGMRPTGVKAFPEQILKNVVTPIKGSLGERVTVGYFYILYVWQFFFCQFPEVESLSMAIDDLDDIFRSIWVV